MRSGERKKEEEEEKCVGEDKPGKHKLNTTKAMVHTVVIVACTGHLYYYVLAAAALVYIFFQTCREDYIHFFF